MNKPTTRLRPMSLNNREGVGKRENGGMRVEYGGVGAREAGIGMWEKTGRRGR